MARLKSLHCLFILLQMYFATEAQTFSKIFISAPESRSMVMEVPEIKEDRIDFNYFECNRLNKILQCSVTEESYELENSTNKINHRNCSITFDGRRLRLPTYGKLKRLIDDIMIVDMSVEQMNIYQLRRYREKGFPETRSVQFINMSNCQVIETHKKKVMKKAQKDYLTNLILRPDNSGRSDLFYTDYKNCKNRRMRIGLNPNGTFFNGPVCIMEDVKELETSSHTFNTEILPFSKEQYFLLDTYDWQWQGYLINYTGNSSKELFRGECDYPDCVPSFRIAIEQNRIRYCSLPKKREQTINCFNVDVKTTENTNFTLTYPYKVLEFEIFNLANGDFITLTGLHEKPIQTQLIESFDDDDEEDEEDDEDIITDVKDKYWRRKRSLKSTNIVKTDFELRRFTNDGILIGNPIIVPGLSCRNSSKRGRVKINQDNNNRICVHFMCKEKMDKENEKDGENSEQQISYEVLSECLNLEKQ